MKFPLALSILIAFSANASAAVSQRFVFASDTQYPWTDTTDERMPERDSDKRHRSMSLILNQAASMNDYRTRFDGLDNTPLFINGDITAFGHGYERNFMYNEPFRWYYQRNFYINLGNHDYKNNVGECANNGCARDMVNDMMGWIPGYQARRADYWRSPGGTYSEYGGSMAYSKVFGDFLAIQLQNEPTYSVKFSSGTAFDKKAYFITKSLRWLEEELSWARDHGKIVILNMHSPPFVEWSGTQADKNEFARLMRQYPVAAIFAGHLHKSMGKFGNGVEGVPVFLSGSASQSTYLIGEYSADERTLRIFGVRGNNYDAKQLVGTVQVPQL